MQIGLELASHGRVVMWRAIDDGIFTIGRNPECDLSVPDDGVAPIQCLLVREGPVLTLVNRDEERGTSLGGEAVRDETRLADGDVIQLAALSATIRYKSAGDDAREGTRTLVRESRADVGLVLSLPELFPGKEWPVDRRGVAVGSDPSNDVVIDDPYVSSFHARFALHDGRCVVTDVGSRNGVFIGEQKVREAEVMPGATVRLGRINARVTTKGAPAAAPAKREQAPARFVGASEPAQRVRQLAARLAANDAAVLVTGETGTGKEVAARLLAAESPRAGKAFVALNCGALSRTLIESELFGHEKGAFTGATQRKQGAFELADGGTLFLDEIGELPLDLQPQFLRVLESGEVRRVGGSETFRVDVRVIAATNRELHHEVAAGKFREDLYHRLHVLALALPALRQRLEDIPELVHYFLAMFTPPGERVTVRADALDKLRAHAWPGNIRELRNVVQRAVLMRMSDELAPSDIVFTPSTLTSRVQTAQATSKRTLSEIERDAIVDELRKNRGNKKEAAVALGVSRSTVHRKLEEYKIEPAEYGGDGSDE